jgi:hypothetical protein
MKQDRDIDNILDECLERMFRGETIEQCLQSYPEQAAELEPLLRTALDIKSATAVSPDAVFRARAREEFHAALQDMEARKGFSFLGLRSWATTVVAVFLAVVVLGSGAVAASGNSMPGEPLYQVKLAKEQVQLTFTFSELGKAELYTRLADKRIDEIVYIASKGDSEQVEIATERLDGYLARVAVLVEEPVLAVGGGPITAPVLERAPVEQPVPEASVPAPEPATMFAEPEAPAGAQRVMAIPPVEEEPPEEETADMSGVTSQETVPPPVVATAPLPEMKEEKVPILTRPLDKKSALKSEVEAKSAENLQKLRTALEKAPESAKPALERSIQEIESSYQKVQDVPGQESAAPAPFP